jgi:hypothetical protein
MLDIAEYGLNKKAGRSLITGNGPFLNARPVKEWVIEKRGSEL